MYVQTTGTGYFYFSKQQKKKNHNFGTDFFTWEQLKITF